MKIKAFFARSMCDYNSDYEREWIKGIMKIANIIEFPEVDEKYKDEYYTYGDGLREVEKKYFFPLINECDLMIAVPMWNGKKKGYYTNGVIMEVGHALGMRKRVMAIVGGVLRDIGQADLGKMYNVYVLDNNNDRNDLIKEDWLGNHKRMIEIHDKTMDLYVKCQEVRDYMKGFLKVRKGCNPIAIQERFPKIGKPIRYLPRNSYRLVFLNELGMKNMREYIGQLHFYECIFDESVKNGDKILREISDYEDYIKKYGEGVVFDKYVIGMRMTFDIDAPIVNGVKVNIFDVYDEYMHIKVKTEEMLLDRGLKSSAIFTGNGIDVVSNEYYFDENDDNLDDVINERNKFVFMMNNIYIGKWKPSIDKRQTSWATYNKLMFTYYNKIDMRAGILNERLTIPVSSGYVDKEWLIENSDYNKVVNNEDSSGIIREIIKESRG